MLVFAGVRSAWWKLRGRRSAESGTHDHEREPVHVHAGERRRSTPTSAWRNGITATTGGRATITTSTRSRTTRS